MSNDSYAEPLEVRKKSRMNSSELISEIRKQKQQLARVCMDGAPYGLEAKGNHILGLLRQLIAIAKDGGGEELDLTSYERAFDDLSHTIEKEVQYAIEAYLASRKKNAAKKRRAEYNEALNRAISQIELDLNLI